MMRRVFTKRELVLIMILAVLFLVSVYYLLVWQPTLQAVEDAELRFDTAEDQIVVENIKAASLRDMQAKLKALNEGGGRKEVAQYDNVHNVVKLLNEVLSKASGYQISFNPVEIEGQIVSRIVNLYYTCDDYQSAQEILTSLKDSPYRCELAAVSVHAETKEAGDVFSDEVSVRATIVFFEFTEQEELEEESE